MHYINLFIWAVLLTGAAICKNKYALLDSKVNLTCNTSGSPWKFNGKRMTPNETYQIKSNNLEIKVGSGQFGNYDCNKTSINLIQGIKPTIIRFKEVPSIPENENLVLNCSIEGRPNVTAEWFKNGSKIEKGIQESTGINGVTTTSLRINSTKSEHSGNYSCRVRNQFGNDSKTFDVTVYAAVGFFNLSTENVTSRSITLRWTRVQKLDSTWQDRQIFVEIESEPGVIRNDSFPSIVGMGNMKLFTDLSPYTNYTLTLREVAGNFSGNSTLISFSTSEDAPSQPTNLTATIGKNFINLSWDAPKYANGIIKYYKVKYRSITTGCAKEHLEKYTNASDTSVELTDLYSNIEYEIELSAGTVKYGNATAIRRRTVPDYPGNATLNITPTEVNSTKVNISWNPLPVCSQGADDLEYELEVKDLVSNITVKNYTNTTSYIFTGFLHNKTYGITLTPTNRHGRGAPSTKIFTTPEGLPTEPFPPSVTQTRTFKHYLVISWKRPLLMNGQPLQCQIEFRKIKSCTSHECKRSIQLSEPVNITRQSNPVEANQNMTVWLVMKEEVELDYFSKYEVRVRESTERGWGPYSNTSLFQIGEGAPSKPLNLAKKSVSHDTATIEWEEPKYPNGIIKSYNLAKSKLGDPSVVKLEIDIVGKRIRYTISNLDSETSYSISIRAKNGYGLGSDSGPLVFTTSAAPPEFPWIFVLIACLAVVLVIVLIITVVLVLGKRKKLRQYRGVQTVEEIDMNGFVQSKPINVTELKQYCAQRHANSDFQFQQEFESLRMLPTHGFTFEHSQMPYNQGKNRYSNILAYDHSRVILSNIENEVGSTYINGNFIDGYQHPKKYIATQGPLPETVLDFWRMVWEQKVPVIVMLTKLLEDNRLKCEQYWPPDTGLQYKDIVVKVISVNELTDYTVRIFEIYKINNPDQNHRIVRHYHYTAWPDHGVPSHPTSMLSFIRHVVSYVDVTRLTVNEAKKLDGPVIVHCSAGVGRTGTFIAIEGCLRQIEQDKRVDIFGTVCQMRRQRNFMVQTESQYTFIYDALLDNYICGNTEIAPADLVAKMRFLNEKDPSTGDTNFVGEFKRLESGITIKDKDYYVDAGHQENKQKNRFLNILPYDKNRVKLVPIAGCRQSDYINASMTDGFQKRNAFIATQAPLENTVNDFWRMIVEQNVHIIVMLTRLEEKGQEKCYLYWPQASTVSYGNVLVGFIDFKQEDNVVIRQLRITNKESQKSWTVTHFMYLGWPDYGSPESGTEIIQMIGLVQRKQRDIQNNSGPILVHCSGGVGRTGVFISVFNSIERLKAKDVVDVFQTTRALRLQRTAMVQTIDQYIFCYQALKDYLDSFDLYANPQC